MTCSTGEAVERIRATAPTSPLHRRLWGARHLKVLE
jgi:hypothetical protein